MIDHDEFDLMGDGAEGELNQLVARLGLPTLVFEVASPKDGPESGASIWPATSAGSDPIATWPI